MVTRLANPKLDTNLLHTRDDTQQTPTLHQTSPKFQPPDTTKWARQEDNGTQMQSTDQMLPLAADLLADLRMVTRASLRVTLRASSLLFLSRLWPAKAVEAHAVAAAMAAILKWESRVPYRLSWSRWKDTLNWEELRWGCSYASGDGDRRRNQRRRLGGELGPQSGLRSVIGCIGSLRNPGWR